MPFELCKKTEKEREHLHKQGVLEPGTQTQQATQIVVLLKPNGKVKICGIYNCTINKVLKQ